MKGAPEGQGEHEEGGEQAGPEGQGEQGVSSACDLFASEQSLKYPSILDFLCTQQY